MRKSSLYCGMGIMVLVIGSSYHLSLSVTDFPITPEQSAKIIEKIYEKYLPVYKKYKGVMSKRQIYIIEYNPNTNLLINRSIVSEIRKEYFYREPEVTIVRFVRNDVTMSPGDYQDHLENPLPPIMDEFARENYRTVISSCIMIEDKRCYRMDVIPLKMTTRHFLGLLYFRCDTLDLVLAEGTLARLPSPKKEFCMKIYFGRINGLPVMNNGSYIMREHIPILVPDRRFVINIKVQESTPL
jgi:hypothetical protein